MARTLKSHVRGKPVLSLSKGSHAWFGSGGGVSDGSAHHDLCGHLLTVCESTPHYANLAERFPFVYSFTILKSVTLTYPLSRRYSPTA